MAAGISQLDVTWDLPSPLPSGRKQRARANMNIDVDVDSREFNLWLRQWHMQQQRETEEEEMCLPEPTSPYVNKFGDLADREENRWLREWHIQVNKVSDEIVVTEHGQINRGLNKRHEWKQGWPSLLRSCCMVVLALPVWFSANSFVPEIAAEYKVGNMGASFIIASVNIGFVIATCFGAVVRLSDRVESNKLVIVGSIACGLFSIVMVTRPPWIVLLLARGFIGAALSLVYPVLVKHLSTWFRALRAVAIGCLLASFTIGVAIPNLVKILVPSASWQLGVLAPSILTFGAAILGLSMRDGPNASRGAEVSIKQVLQVFGDPLWNYVTIAYVGHSFELFGGWAYMGAFLKVYFDDRDGLSDMLAPAMTFLVVASGAFGCILAGYCADRFSRGSILLFTNLVSGCSITALPFLRDSAPQWLLLMVACLWGLSVNADSALYTALVTEVTKNAKVVGTALTLSIACGFAMTACAIFVVPLIVLRCGWNVAFPCLGCGPLVSILAILRLNVKLRQES